MTLKEVQGSIRSALHSAVLASVKWDSVKTVKFKKMMEEGDKHLQKYSNLEKAQGFLLRLNALGWLLLKVSSHPLWDGWLHLLC